MSREVRRVPLDWKHPTEPNPYWVEQQQSRWRRGAPESRLHAAELRFVGLMDDYPGRLTDWETEVREMKARQGHGWSFAVEYHLTGYQGRNDSEPTVYPFYGWTEDGMTETETVVRDEDHLYQLAVAKVEGEKPNPDDYMPVFDGDELGWCLYETVSEGTPVTPVFATADELVEHLATVGQDWDQQPMRRAAAEVLVRAGSSMGSMVAIGGVLFNSSSDADLIETRLAGGFPVTSPRSFREAFTEDPADVKDRARLVEERDSARDWAVVLENRIEKTLALHARSVLTAGELIPGECYYCQSSPDLLLVRRYRGYLNSAKTKTWLHDHDDSHPVCLTCAGSGWDMNYAEWPCPSVAALTGGGDE